MTLLESKGNLEEISKLVNFLVTNESLPAIILGLQPSEEDTVLSICGSGDQALALAEKAKKVIAIDSDPKTLAYAKKRWDLIRLGEYDSAFRVAINNPNEYLSDQARNSRRHLTDERLRKVAIKNIEFTRGCIFDIKTEATLAYISNAMTYTPDLDSMIKGSNQKLSRLVRNNPQLRRIYLADGGEVYRTGLFYSICSQFIVNHDLSKKAKQEEDKLSNWSAPSWNPVVLDRVN